ncbi:MAG TPA: PIG-L family deacetylase [Candidatus Binatia bacterium]|nr:PIG-L family deacetylase [Candidatus Binatia bacterium]
MEKDLIPYHTTDLHGHRVLVFAPHPDDETFACGGSLALHRRHGDPVRVVFITSGELGSWQEGQDPEACRARREAEVHRALACLGVEEWEFWRYPDRGVEADGALLARVAETIRNFNPTLVYVPSPLEIHPDHRAVAQALRAALRGWPGELCVSFYEVGYALPPNALVDVTQVWEVKEQAMQAYESQLPGHAYLAAVWGLNRFRALTLGPQVTAAEAFRRVPVSQLDWDMIWRWQVLREPAPTSDRPPAVSVIVRTKNRPGFLREALESLMGQTFRDFEVIVVNDGGQDVGPVLVEYANLRSTLVRLEPGQGRAAATNAGVRAAQGEFVTYLDDDDLYYPPHLETLYSFLSRHDHFGAAYTDANLSRYRLNPESQRYELIERRVENSQDFDPDWLLQQNYIHNLCLMHRREGWERVGGLDPNLNLLEDWDFFIRLAQEYPFYHLRRCTAEYRIRDDGTNLSEQRPWGRVDEVSVRAAIYQRYWVKRSPEMEVRIYDKLQHEKWHYRQQIVSLQQQLREALDAHARELSDLRATNASLQQEQHQALAGMQELKEALGVRERDLLEREARLQAICASTGWKLYHGGIVLLRPLFRVLRGTVKRKDVE